MKQKTKNLEKGITLIALVITIIVLLILAGVAINTLFGDNGILNKGRTAKLKTENATVVEQAKLLLNEFQLYKRTDGITSNSIEYLQGSTTPIAKKEEGKKVASLTSVKVADTTSSSTPKIFMTKMEGKDPETYLVEWKIAIPNGTTGRGKEYKKDQYLVEKVNEKVGNITYEYLLSYYNEKGEQTKLLYINPDGSSYTTDEGKKEDDSKDDSSDDTPAVTEDDPTISSTDSNSDGKTKYKIQKIEDLVQLAINVNNGYNYDGKTIGIVEDLDFNEDSSYRDPSTTEFGDLDGNGTAEGLKVELTSGEKTETDGSKTKALGITGEGMPQIGETEDKPFKGAFNGQNHMLSNYQIGIVSDTTRTVIGLFGYNEGKIVNFTLNSVQYYTTKNDKNLGIIVGCNKGRVTKSSITGTYSKSMADPANIGGIVDRNEGEIKTCINNMPIDIGTFGGTKIAGIVNQNNGTVENCENNVDLNTNTNTYAAGIVLTNNGIVRNCINNGSIGKNGVAGGIIAINTSTQPIENCTNGVEGTDKVMRGNTIAGIISENQSTNLSVINCNNYIGLTGSTGATKAGIVVNKSSNTSATINIQNCNNYANIEDPYAGGILSSQTENVSSVVIKNCINKGNIIAYARGGGITNIYGTNNLEITNCSNYGNIKGVASNGYLSGIITNAKVSNGNTGTIEKCSNYGTIQNGMYSAGIVGQASNINIINCQNGNEELKNKSVNMNDEFLGYSAGIVAEISGGTVENCTNYMNITSDYWSAGIVGSNQKDNTVITDCTNYGKIQYYTNVGPMGGIVGKGEKLSISNCNNYGDLTETHVNGNVEGAGGILGSGTGDIDNCINHANINGAGNGTGVYGGIAGFINGNIQNSKNEGTVTGKALYYGGISGKSNGNIINCSNIADIEIEESLDTIAGITTKAEEVSNCYNIGNITVNTNAGKVVGIAGSATNINNCYNIGNIGYTIAGSYAGGIAISSTTIRDCYNKGNVHGGIETISDGVSRVSMSGCISAGGTTIENCYNTGTLTVYSDNTAWKEITTNENFIGTTGTATNCYTIAPGGEEDECKINIKTENEMQSQAFADILNSSSGVTRNVWEYDANKNGAYPYLKANYHE